MSQIIGVVLAGGSGRRMGRTKGDLQLQGKSMARRAGEILFPVCSSVLISLGEGSDNPAEGFPAVYDAPPPGRGPLAGIEAAFAATGSADLLVLACDYPQMEQGLLRSLIEAAGDEDQLVMPVDVSGRDHPLAALWRRTAEEEVAEALSRRRYKVRALLADLAVHRLGPSDLPAVDLRSVLTNINTPQQWEELRKPPGPAGSP